MKIVFIGCVEFSHSILQHLLSLGPHVDVVGVVTRKKSSLNADFRSLEDIAVAAQIPCFLAEGNNQTDIVDWMKELDPDIVYCFGWSYLLGLQILQVPRLGVVGYHPAALPQNRGRHPIIWALALGLSETASTFFFMNEGADSGDILNQIFVSIDPADDAAGLYIKLTAIAKNQVAEFTLQLAMGNYPRLTQDHSKANYWRKRNKTDGLIDWRMSAVSIYNLVRSLTKPYPGAHCIHNGVEFKIWKTEQAIDGFENIEPGKVLEIVDREIIVKCGEGVLKLISHDFTDLPKEGSYL